MRDFFFRRLWIYLGRALTAFLYVAGLFAILHHSPVSFQDGLAVTLAWTMAMFPLANYASAFIGLALAFFILTFLSVSLQGEA